MKIPIPKIVITPTVLDEYIENNIRVFKIKDIVTGNTILKHLYNKGFEYSDFIGRAPFHTAIHLLQKKIEIYSIAYLAFFIDEIYFFSVPDLAKSFSNSKGVADFYDCDDFYDDEPTLEYDKCPVCGFAGKQGFNLFECLNNKCQNYTKEQED